MATHGSLELLEWAQDRVAGKKGSIAAMRHGERYEEWCSKEGVECYPLSEHSVAGYLFQYVEENKGSTRSVGNVKSNLKRYCEDKGVVWLSDKESRRVNELIRELKIIDMSVGQRKQALQRKFILQIVAQSDMNNIHELYLCLLLETGHNGLLRSGELLSGVIAEDVLWYKDRSGFRMKIDWTKTGGVAYIDYWDFGGVNAVSLMRRWWKLKNLSNFPDAQVFPAVRHGGKGFDFSKPASQQWLRKWIKKAVASVGLDPRKYSGHSLRAGGATDLFVARVPYYIIKKKGRWVSDAAMLYYRDEEDIQEAVSKAFAMWK